MINKATDRRRNNSGRPPYGKPVLDASGRVTPRITLTMPPALKSRIVAYADATGQTMSRAIIEILIERLDREEV